MAVSIDSRLSTHRPLRRRLRSRSRRLALVAARVLEALAAGAAISSLPVRGVSGLSCPRIRPGASGGSLGPASRGARRARIVRSFLRGGREWHDESY